MSKATYHVPQPGEAITFDGHVLPIVVKSWDSKHGIVTADCGRRDHIKDRSSIRPAEPGKKPAPEKKAEEFKVGDRVVATKAFDGNKEIVGIRGTVNKRKGIVTRKSGPKSVPWVGVNYDKKLSDGHDMGGNLPGHSWDTGVDCLRHLTPEELAEEANAIPQTESVKEEVRVDAEDELHWVDSSAGEPVAVATAFTARLPTSFASEIERAQAIADAEAEEKKRRSAAIDELKRQSDEIRVLLNKQHDALVVEDDAREDYQLRVDYLFSLRVRGE